VARNKGPKKTNRYPDEFKIRAVQLADHSDILAKDVAEDLGVHPILLYRWRKEFREGKFKQDGRRAKLRLDTQKISELLQIQQLKRENERLRIENELLKKR
jgi:transposase